MKKKKQKQRRKQMKIRFVDFIVPLFLEFNHTQKKTPIHPAKKEKIKNKPNEMKFRFKHQQYRHMTLRSKAQTKKALLYFNK